MNRGIEQYHDKEFQVKELPSESGVIIRDLEGNEYPLQATITYEYELNGNQNATFTIFPSSVNNLFIDNISEMWEFIDENEVEYKIVYCKKQGKGERLNAQIKAIPLFFDRFDTDRVYEEYNQHMTAQNCFNIIFQDSEYNVVLNGTFEAIQWEGFGGGDTRLNMFKNALNRYKAEFRIVGNTIYVENLIGRDTQFMYRYKLNASNIVQENDATAYYTYAKGYGNYSDEDGWQGAKLIREYTSPLAQIIGIRHAPPIQNGNITTNATMDEQLKILVDESLKISVQANIHDLKDYPLAQPQVGDRSFLIDERIGLETEVRINYLRITKDWQGNIRDIQATFGSPNIVKRHQANLQNAIKNITQLLEGKVKLPFSVYDARMQEVINAMNSALTQLTVLEDGSLAAIDPENPNFMVMLKSNGLFLSEDGGATPKQAIYGGGINASVISAGSMLADRIAGGILQSLNGRTHFNLNDGKLNIKQGAITIERPDGAAFMQDGLANLNYNVFAHNPPYTSPNVEINNYFYRTQSTSPENLNFYTYRHEGRYLKLHLAYYISNNDEGVMGNIYIVDSTNGNTLLTKTITNTGSNSDNAVFGEILTIDLGVPNFSRNAFYLRLRTASDVVFAYARVIRIWQEG